MLLPFVSYNTFLLISHLDDSDTGFNDLGKLMLIGFIAAVLVAVGFTVVRLKLRDKKPRPSSFTTISGIEERK